MAETNNEPGDASSKEALAQMRRDLAAIPEPYRAQIELLAGMLRSVMKGAGPVGYSAIGLVCAEVAAGEAF